jgi:hypothetical protein
MAFADSGHKRLINVCGTLGCASSRCAIVAICIGTACAAGCSKGAASVTDSETPPPARSIFAEPEAPSACPAECVASAVAIAREGLGLDPDDHRNYGRLTAAEIFESLDRVGRIYDSDGRFKSFLQFKPVATAGYSIYIYHLTRAEADRARDAPTAEPAPAK